MIIGIKEDGKVILAYMTKGYKNVNSSDLVAPENVGLWKIEANPHTIMGCVRPTAESDAYRYEGEMFTGEIDYDSLIDRIVPAMEAFTADKEYIGTDDDRYEHFLIAKGDRLFHITNEHIVTEVDTFVVVGGYNEDLSKGVLFATKGEPAIDRIRKAAEFAAAAGDYEAYPICVMDTETCNLSKLTRENKID